VNLLEEDDKWSWRPGRGDGFSVKSTYVFLDNLFVNCAPLSTVETFVFKFIWKSGVPSKVSALAWQLVLDKIPSRDNLRRRGVIRLQDALCPSCSSEVESACHFFLHCPYSASIWYDVTRWYGVVAILPSSMPMSLVVLVGCGSNRRRRKGLAVVWLTFIWVVWKLRNDRVFNQTVVDARMGLELIQRLSWRWFLNNSATGSSLLYEWVWNPGDCMLR
jgi:hypothetical protein